MIADRRTRSPNSASTRASKASVLRRRRRILMLLAEVTRNNVELGGFQRQLDVTRSRRERRFSRGASTEQEQSRVNNMARENFQKIENSKMSSNNADGSNGFPRPIQRDSDKSFES